MQSNLCKFINYLKKEQEQRLNELMVGQYLIEFKEKRVSIVSNKLEML